MFGIKRLQANLKEERLAHMRTKELLAESNRTAIRLRQQLPELEPIKFDLDSTKRALELADAAQADLKIVHEEPQISMARKLGDYQQELLDLCNLVDAWGISIQAESDARHKKVGPKKLAHAQAVMEDLKTRIDGRRIRLMEWMSQEPKDFQLPQSLLQEALKTGGWGIYYNTVEILDTTKGVKPPEQKVDADPLF